MVFAASTDFDAVATPLGSVNHIDVFEVERVESIVILVALNTILPNGARSQPDDRAHPHCVVKIINSQCCQHLVEASINANIVDGIYLGVLDDEFDLGWQIVLAHLWEREVPVLL